MKSKKVKQYLKCYLCKFISKTRYNQCTMHKFKNNEELLCSYSTAWSLWKWWVRCGLPICLILFLTSLIKKLFIAFHEINVLNLIISGLFWGACFALSVLAVLTLIALGVGAHEAFHARGGRYIGRGGR